MEIALVVLISGYYSVRLSHTRFDSTMANKRKDVKPVRKTLSPCYRDHPACRTRRFRGFSRRAFAEHVAGLGLGLEAADLIGEADGDNRLPRVFQKVDD